MKFLYHFRTRGFGAEAVHISGMACALERAGQAVTFSSPTGVDPRQNARAREYKDVAHRGLIAKIAMHSPRLLFELLEVGYNVQAWMRNARLLETLQPDWIYERHAFFLCATGFLARSRGLPLVVEVNELAGDERVRDQPVLLPLAVWSDRLLFRRATLVIVVSPHLKRRIVAMGVEDRRVLVLPNAVDPAEFGEQRTGKVVRERFGLGEGPVIGFVGWLAPWHKLEMLVEVFERLANEFAGLKLLLVGDGVLRPRLEAMVAERQLQGRLILTGGVGHGEIAEYISAADICVVPHSNQYRSPIKLFEYMGQGRAVVAARTEPIEMIVRHGENGMLFEPGSSNSMEAALGELLRDDALRTRMGQQARNDVLKHHTWDRNAEEVLRKLRELSGPGCDPA